MMMENQIIWKTDLKEALKTSRKENKPLLIDFFNPG